jgi:hypothetical protein
VERALGEWQPEGKTGIKNYSTIEPNAYGYFRGTDRTKVDRAELRFIVPVGEEERIKQLIAPRMSLLTPYHTGRENIGRGSMVYGIASLDDISTTQPGPPARVILSVTGTP